MLNSPRPDSRPQVARFLAIVLAAVSLPLPIASAQLSWGSGGNGGAGTWNAANTNWWNGTSNVIWNGGAAVFAGTGGLVTPQTFLSLTGLTFNSPGYTIGPGSIYFSPATATVTTNQPATITSDFNGRKLIKAGPATLTQSGTGSFQDLQIDAGEYLINGFTCAFLYTTTFANTAGAILTLGQSDPIAHLGTLSGGGLLGGVLRPGTEARTVTGLIDQSGTFGGVIQDNGAGKLAMDFNFNFSGKQTLTGASTYSGPTTLADGTLEFSGGGSAVNSPVSVAITGILRLDNTLTLNANRLSNSLDLTLRGGRLDFLGHRTVAVTEQTGALTFSSAATVTATSAGPAAALIFAAATRQNHGTLDLSGTGRIKWTGMANNSSGIVGSYLTMGNEWATVGGDGSASPLATYATNLNTALTTSHVKLGAGLTTLSATATRATLNWQNSSGVTATLALGSSQILTLSAGGLLSSGSAANVILSGTLRSGTTELIVINRNALSIAANLGETTPGTFLTKSGLGTLTLSGTNAYSGNTVINQGTLVVAADAHLGTGPTIDFRGGSLRAAGSFISAKGLLSTESNAIIDTAGFDLTFAGKNDGLISKRGLGDLTLTHPEKGTVYLIDGSLTLPDAVSGAITNFGGLLRASGTFTSIGNFSGSILDIAGALPGTLRTNSFSNTSTLRFDIGGASRDLLSVATYFSGGTASSPQLFDFHNLGDTATGTTYTLIELPPTVTPAADTFALTPAALAAGWAGTFSVAPGSVSVTFSSVPEPSSLSCLALISFGFFLRRRP